MNEFPIAPAASRYLWFVIPVLAVLVVAMALVLISVRGSRTARFEVRSDGLALHGDLYGRVIPKTQLRLELARRVNLMVESDLRPRSRRVGTALPGYQAGWFRLANGEKALLYLTDRTRAVYIPTTAGYGLLLSPLDPDAFLARLGALRS
jgi:hypothetical protein